MTDRIRWINKGRTQRILGKIIKPNEVFFAFPDEVPANLRHFIVPIDTVPAAPIPDQVPPPPVETPVPVATETPAPVEEEKPDSIWPSIMRRPRFTQPAPSVSTELQELAAASNYTLQERSPGWFDIIDSTGKVVNEQPQTEEDAKDLIKKLG